MKPGVRTVNDLRLTRTTAKSCSSVHDAKACGKAPIGAGPGKRWKGFLSPEPDRHPRPPPPRPPTPALAAAVSDDNSRLESCAFRLIRPVASPALPLPQSTDRKSVV